MNDFLIYVFKVSLVFSLLTITYYLAVRRLTFHSVNRALLLLIIPLSLALPLMDFGIQTPVQLEMLQPADLAGDFQTEQLAASEATTRVIDYRMILDIAYFLGLILSAALIILNGLKLFQIIRSSSSIPYRKLKVLRADVPDVFSSFRWVFVPKHYDLKNGEFILRHEGLHLKYRHSYDLLLTELFIALTWFNPFVYLFRQMLRSVHEFQVDEQVINGNVKKSDYLTLMLETAIGNYRPGFASSFKHSNIKDRIKMITKNKNSRRHTGKYALFLPVMLIATLALADLAGSEPSIFPISKGDFEKISSPYGVERKSPFTGEKKVHGGIDIVAKSGTPIMATGSGKVVKAELKEKWGNLVIIDHGDGFETWYAHMKDIAVKEGQKVNSRDIIGHVGNTGLSTAPHLHYEVRKDGARMNPEDFFVK